MSRCLELALRTFALGIVPRGGFTLLEIRHDPDCPSLITGSALHCSCDCEIVFGEESHLYLEVVEQRWRP
jgi:hypothetical protein